MNPTFTLQQIRDASPCASGWITLLHSLGYANGAFDPNRIVSLGDVAQSNSAADAIWCLRVLDWSDVTVRRAIIADAVLPAVKRASKYTVDPRVFDAIEVIEKWCAGDDSVDLEAAARVAYAAARAAYAAARDATYAATYAARAAARAADAACAAADAEREQQRTDIITAFPKVAFGEPK